MPFVGAASNSRPSSAHLHYTHTTTSNSHNPTTSASSTSYLDRPFAHADFISRTNPSEKEEDDDACVQRSFPIYRYPFPSSSSSSNFARTVAGIEVESRPLLPNIEYILRRKTAPPRPATAKRSGSVVRTRHRPSRARQTPPQKQSQQRSSSLVSTTSSLVSSPSHQSVTSSHPDPNHTVERNVSGNKDRASFPLSCSASAERIIGGTNNDNTNTHCRTFVRRRHTTGEITSADGNNNTNNHSSSNTTEFVYSPTIRMASMKKNGTKIVNYAALCANEGNTNNNNNNNNNANLFNDDILSIPLAPQQHSPPPPSQTKSQPQRTSAPPKKKDPITNNNNHNTLYTSSLTSNRSGVPANDYDYTANERNNNADGFMEGPLPPEVRQLIVNSCRSDQQADEAERHARRLLSTTRRLRVYREELQAARAEVTDLQQVVQQHALVCDTLRDEVADLDARMAALARERELCEAQLQQQCRAADRQREKLAAGQARANALGTTVEAVTAEVQTGGLSLKQLVPNLYLENYV